jgi:hypothetical protein
MMQQKILFMNCLQHPVLIPAYEKPVFSDF